MRSEKLESIRSEGVDTELGIAVDYLHLYTQKTNSYRVMAHSKQFEHDLRHIRKHENKIAASIVVKDCATQYSGVRHVSLWFYRAISFVYDTNF
jgi:hypothetical protein